MTADPFEGSTSLDHEALLRKAFAVAERAVATGNHPFGAILVGPDGAVYAVTENPDARTSNIIRVAQGQ